jgi:hypothetical protein
LINHEDFRICCPEAWQFSDANYNEDESDDDGDISELFKKKNKVNIRVKKL